MMNKKRTSKYPFMWRYLFIVPLLFAASSQAIETNDATRVVEDFHDVLIDTMKNADSLGFKGRYEKILGEINSSFDTPLIAQVILSRYWTELSTEKQDEFIKLFNELSASTYASRFDSYSGESFKTFAVDELKKGRLLVRTEMTKSNGDKVKFEYLVHQKDGKWYIISVVADGVNDLALKRAEYEKIISDRGYDSLLGEIQAKISEMQVKS